MSHLSCFELLVLIYETDLIVSSGTSCKTLIYILTCISGHVWYYIYEMYHYSETISKQSYGHNDISLVIQYKAK